MTTKVTLPGSEIIDFNLKVEYQTKYFYKFETWTPIMGALLLSGIIPTDYWRNCPEQPENSMRSSFFWIERLDQLLKGLWEEDDAGEERIPQKNRKHLVGLDGKVLATYSGRFQEARSVLKEWGDKCEDEEKYLSEVAPGEFVAWLEEVCADEGIAFFDRTWLDAFLKLHGLEKSEIILPTKVMEAFRMVTETGDDRGWHPLSTDIFHAQQQAKSKSRDPYAVQVIFPLVNRILDDRGAIDKANDAYLPGKTLPVQLDDGSLYVLKRDSLRVHLGRLKAKYFSPQQQSDTRTL